MTPKKLVKACNIIGIVSIVLLVYWVFAFILIQVFGLKVFREHITETFGLSIMGIIALMGGALMLNIMLNLTRIAERGQEAAVAGGRKAVWLFLAVFPLLAVLMFGGNYLTVRQKERLLVQSAEKLVRDYPQQMQALAAYRFDDSYLSGLAGRLKLLENQDSAFRDVTLIVPDRIDQTPVFMGFGSTFDFTPLAAVREKAGTENAAVAVAAENDALVYRLPDGKTAATVKKADHLFAADLSEREYLKNTFRTHSGEIRFESENGNYELFYPYRQNGKTVAVFRFSDYQRYGKLGS